MDNLGSLLTETCKTFADARALDDTDRALTYRQLSEAASAIERALLSVGLTPDEPVLVPVANEARDPAALMGVWRAGGVAVPVARNAPASSIEAMRATTGARFSLTNTAEEPVSQVGEKAPPHRPLLEGAALIVFTSGSTGRPKGLLVLQITFVFGMWISLLTLLRGGTLLMHSRFEPMAILAALKEQRISDAAFVPTMLRKFLSLDETVSRTLFADAGLERILTGGEPFGRELGARLRKLLPKASIVDIYGLTETCSSDFFLREHEHEKFAETIGRPSPGVQFRIADDQGRKLPVNTTGELQIRTPFIMNGYLDEPELTRLAFAGGFFRTGDLARIREDGRAELAGRIKELIIRGGAKVSPLELDYILIQHPAVAAALTTGVPDSVMGERIHALIVPRANARIEENDLREWIAGRIERFKWPDVYHFGRELPTGRTGKVDRSALRDQVLGPSP